MTIFVATVTVFAALLVVLVVVEEEPPELVEQVRHKSESPASYLRIEERELEAGERLD